MLEQEALVLGGDRGSVDHVVDRIVGEADEHRPVRTGHREHEPVDVPGSTTLNAARGCPRASAG